MLQTMRMSATEKELFESAIKRSKEYLEYGSGGSTTEALRISQSLKVTSVESDPDFFENQIFHDETIRHAIETRRLRFLNVDIGDTIDWGYPKDSEKSYLWPNYALCPYMQRDYQPDLILIDGRFRVACALAGALHAPESCILIHDYTKRPHYHILENFLDMEASVETLALFMRKPDFDARLARGLLREYLHLPGDRDPLR